MASQKLSQLTPITNSSVDDLLLISHTSDSGATFETTSIRVADFFNDINQDTDLQSIVALSGVSAGATTLGTFLGNTLSNNVTVKQALQELETATEAKQDALTAGDGLSLNGGDISVAIGTNSFLEMIGGELFAKVLNEDDFASASADHAPTQASVQNYIATKEGDFDGRYVHQDGSTAFAADQDMGGNRLTGLGSASLSTDAVTKGYVDSATSGLGAFWQVVDLLADAPITLSGEQTIDGVLTSATRVLVVAQADPTENGLYVSDAGAWTRAADGDEIAEFKRNKTVAVAAGSFNAGSVYAYTGGDDPTIGTDALPFTQKQSASAVSDGSITDVKLADGAVTDIKVQSISSSKLTGTLLDSTVAESNVTQHQAALQITESQITDLQAYALAADQSATAAKTDALVTLSGVAAEATDLGIFSGTTISENATVKAALQELEGLSENTSNAMQAAQLLLGVAGGSSNLGSFNGSIINDATNIKLALQQLESAIETQSSTDLADSENITRAGDNVSDLVANTAADAEPASWLFLVVDAADGAIKAIDKTFIEVE